MPGFRMCVFEIASDIPCNDKIGDRLKQRGLDGFVDGILDGPCP